ncbi:MAG: cadherin-like beta sandwich domain-containing protein [Lachnospiraceae bacterium]|nr:cadherin-like beta sandwich domain-containing protein [Lachnospiraceae bacterium]
MKRNSILKTFVLAVIFAVTFVTFAFAGTAVIQFSDPTVTRDKTFNVACKVKSTDVRLKTADITVQYDAQRIEFVEGTNAEGGAGTIRINGTGVGRGSGTQTLEYQLKFKALYAGTTGINVVDQEVTDTTDNLVNVTKFGTSTIKVNPTNTQSTDANLATLEFSPGELDREFDPSVTAYNVEVNSDVEALTIQAIAEDRDATVIITGNENFITGMNRVAIDVTAPDNVTTKQYVLNVTKLDTGITDGNTTITNGQRFTSNPYTITIMIKPDDVPIPSGYKKLTGEFGGNTIEAYGPTNIVDGDTPEVFLIYGMNQDGVMDFYRYDRRNGDNTIQRYVAEANAGNYEALLVEYNDLGTKYNEAAKRLNIIFPAAIVLVVLVVILIIVLIVIIVKNGSNRNKSAYDKYKDYSDDDDDDDDDYFRNARPTKINRASSNKDSDDIDDEEDEKDEKKDVKAEPDNYEEDIEDNLDEIEDLG